MGKEIITVWRKGTHDRACVPHYRHTDSGKLGRAQGAAPPRSHSLPDHTKDSSETSPKPWFSFRSPASYEGTT